MPNPLDLRGIRSLSDFQRNTKAAIRQMKRSGRPQVLTVNGKAELVVQDAVAYQKMLDLLARAEAIEGIRVGLKDFEEGRSMPVKRSLDRIRKKHGIPHRDQ